jgi:hypothetical protein
MDEQTDGLKDGRQMDEQTDGRKDRQIDGWMNKQMHRQTGRQTVR